MHGDAPPPAASQGMAQRLRFTDSPEGITLNLSNQAVDSLKNLAVLLLPLEIILPRLFAKDQSHGARGAPFIGEPNLLDVTVGYLRRKIEPAVPGINYLGARLPNCRRAALCTLHPKLPE